MFCNRCGAACEDTAMFCNACGNMLQSAPQAPAQPEPQQPVYQQPVYEQPAYQQPVYQQPVYQQPVYQQPAPVKVREPIVYKPFGLDVKTPLKKVNHLVVATIAVFAFVMFILSTFSILDLPVKLTVRGDELDNAYEMVEENTDIETNVNSAKVYLSAGEIKDIYEMAEENDLEDMAEYIDMDLRIGSATPIYVGNILFGMICLLISGVAVLYVLKKFANLPVYDQVVGKLLKLADPTFIICGLGVVGALMQVFFYLFAGSSAKMEDVRATLSMGVPAMTWIALVVFLLVGAVNLMTQSKEK